MQHFTFIDLFAGIGGFRLAADLLGGKCVFSSEWNKYSQQTYQANFGELPSGDITTISAINIPDHDILLGGFPCQPFSIAGVSKHNALGVAHGFDHPTQGTLFFDVVRIIQEKQPKAFILENVKNLKSHDKGKTFAIIKQTLQEELGYTIYDSVINARALVPQNRQRIFIVGFKEQIRFKFPRIIDQNPQIKSILEQNVDPKYTLTNHLWQYLQAYAAKHKANGNGFGYGLVDLNGIARTLSARYYKDGSEILIPQIGKNPRRLTPRECARLMGFPDEFQIPVSDTQAYRQFGNAVVPLVVREILVNVLASLEANKPVTSLETIATQMRCLIHQQ